MSSISGKEKAHKHKLFGPVGLKANPGFLLILHSENRGCPRDKPCLSLGQTRGRRAAEKVHVLKVYVLFLLATITLTSMSSLA